MEARINFNPLLLPLEIFSKPSCSFRIWTVLILPPHRQFKGLIKGKVLPGCGMKRAPSDSITFLFLSSYFCVCITCMFYFLVLSQSNFYALLCLICFCLVIFSVFLCFVFHIKIEIKIEKLKKNITKTVCVLCTLVFVYLGWPLKQNFLNFVSLVAQMSISMHN